MLWWRGKKKEEEAQEIKGGWTLKAQRANTRPLLSLHISYSFTRVTRPCNPPMRICALAGLQLSSRVSDVAIQTQDDFR